MSRLIFLILLALLVLASCEPTDDYRSKYTVRLLNSGHIVKNCANPDQYLVGDTVVVCLCIDFYIIRPTVYGRSNKDCDTAVIMFRQ